MSGFSEDDRIRHKNIKFGDAFTTVSREDKYFLLVGEGISISEIVQLIEDPETYRKHTYSVTLLANNTIMVDKI